MSTAVKAPPNTTIILGGTPYQLKWDKAAIFRADDIGLFNSKKGLGFAQYAKFVWCMLPEAGRRAFPDPADVANAMPPLAATREIVDNAYSAATEEADPKNVFGSTNGPSPASSSDSRTKSTSK